MKKILSILCFAFGLFLLLGTIALFSIGQIGGGLFFFILTAGAVVGGIFLLKSSKTSTPAKSTDSIPIVEHREQPAAKRPTKEDAVQKTAVDSERPQEKSKARGIYIKAPQKTRIVLYEKYIYFKREGAMNAMTRGLQGEKKIPYRNITSVQFKPAAGLTNGYIQFSILGSAESKRGIQSAVHDENSIMFTKDFSREAEYVRKFVEDKILN